MRHRTARRHVPAAMLLVAGLSVLGTALGAQQAMPRPAAPPESAAQAALRQEVEGLTRGLEAAFARGDLKEVAGFYHDSAVIRTPTGVAARGRAEVDAYFVDLPAPKSWKLESYGVTDGAVDGLVYQTGRSTLVYGTPEATSVVEFVLVWKRDASGRLRVMLDYYHAPEQRARRD